MRNKIGKICLNLFCLSSISGISRDGLIFSKTLFGKNFTEQNIIKPKIHESNIPGNIPAMKSFPIDTSARIP